MEEHERQIGREMRSLEVEIRQQKQCISRLRLDIDTEKAAREKAETSVLKLSQSLDVSSLESYDSMFY
jgi:anti-anti-sigma regulatory factor